MAKKNAPDEIVITKDAYWWMGPAGVLSIIILIIFAMLKTTAPVRLDDLPARTRNRVKRAVMGNKRAIWLDMEVTPITRTNAREFGLGQGLRGVVVTDVNHGQGATAGMNIGDVIVAVNGTKISDFDAFLWLAKQSSYSDGILLDVITNGMRRYVSVPFSFNGGPLTGPNTNHWQLGSPVGPQAFGYGKLVAMQNSRGVPAGFLVCQICGHTEAAQGSDGICPNCGVQMVPNQ